VRWIAVVAALFVLAVPAGAAASDRLDVNASHVRLAVNKRGLALVTYRARGRTVHAIVWGAVNALPPSQSVPQVRLQIDWTGGWADFHHRLIWKRFGNACRPYDGPALAWLIAACKAPDGSYWALQAWQPYLPHRGYGAWLSSQTQWELHVSHWTGPLAELDVYRDWAFNGQAHDLFGRLTYGGVPVHGFGTGKNGGPSDRYGRSLYIDTFDSAYGSGWKRETSIVFRKPSGGFCYSFWPTHDKTLPGYPNNLRPPGEGKRYRITVMGPGVTPDVMWEAAGLHDFNAGNPQDVDLEHRMDAIFMQILGRDRFCSTQR
jgi:hypothetical protein